MEKLHSETTFIWKYVFPWTIIGGLTIFFFMSIYMLIFPLTIVLIIIGVFLIAIFRNMLLNLKFVYLDRPNKQLVVKHSSNKIIVPISNIKRIEKLVFSQTQLTVKLKKPNELGSDFTFIPKGTILGWCPPENVLNELINKQNSRPSDHRRDSDNPPSCTPV